MDQFRQIGEVLGGLKALMVLQDEIPINRRQCCLLLDIFTLAFMTIAEEIKQNLKLEEKNTKWKPMEEPLKEMHRIFKEGELYIRRCLDHKDWWAKAIFLHQNKDCTELHIHNLLSSFPAVIEAIENVAEISGLDQDEMQKKRVMVSNKYDRSWNDAKLFEWRFGKQYLLPREIHLEIESAFREDTWILTETIKEKKKEGWLTKNDQQLGDLLLKKLNEVESVNGKVLPSSSVLLEAEDYRVMRRLGGGSQYKEIQWLEESFALRHLTGDIEPLSSEILSLLSLSHPNIVQYLCGFCDEEKRECFLVMELMSKDLYSHMKENSSPRRRSLFPLPVTVDIMLQIARGMEFLHSRKLYVGDLNPTNVFVKPRKFADGYFNVKVLGFGLKSIENHPTKHQIQNHNVIDPCFWYAPEVLAEQEQPGNACTCKYTEKADVYSFGMICFQLLTGKLPSEEGHLQGDQMMKNIRTGERPLFPSQSPKYLVSLTKKCWHSDPRYRPSFSCICAGLRYIKKFLLMSSHESFPHMTLPLDCADFESTLLKKNQGGSGYDISSVSQIPLQMFAYRIAEKEKTSLSSKFKNADRTSEVTSNAEEENMSLVEDPNLPATDTKSAASDMRSVYFDIKSICTEFQENKMIPDLRSVQSEPIDDKILLLKNTNSIKLTKVPVKVRARVPNPKPSPWSPAGNIRKQNCRGQTRNLSSPSPSKSRSPEKN